MISINDLNCYYGPYHALKNINIAVEPGEFIGIIGPNGAGKSTFIKCIANLTKYSGEIKINGKKYENYGELAKVIAYFPPEIHSTYNYSVFEIISMGRLPHTGLFGELSESDYKSVETTLALTELTELRNRKIHSLSSGEKQLVFLAQTLAQESPIIILDEPTTHLDITHQIKIYEVLKKLNSEKKITVLSVNHDINLASFYSDKIIAMKDGYIFASGAPQEVIKKEIIDDLYSLDSPFGLSVDNGLNGRPVIYLNARNNFCLNQNNKRGGE